MVNLDPLALEHTDRRFNQTTDRYAADDLETIREARRYGAHVFELLRPYVGRRVLEVGCGIGTMSQKLTALADIVVGIEPNLACLERVEDAVRNVPNFTLRPCHLEECDPLELAGHRFDTVFCVNVLEHLQYDVEALTLFRDVIVPAGKVLVFVPAVMAAYGALDAELGHHRRYSRRTLSDAFAAAGLELLMLRYTNPLGLIGWMYNTYVSKARVHSLAQVRLFERFVAPWALPLERAITPPIGLSLMAVGRRPVPPATETR
jgi:2-polyprenyl-3-methyl-5-hydroxy-6-metoxy-1,4-benzoquinol methylase